MPELSEMDGEKAKALLALLRAKIDECVRAVSKYMPRTPASRRHANANALAKLQNVFV